jgi:hypothetical protein
MGLFSKKKTYVNTSVTPLVANTPNLVADSIFSSILQGRPLTPDLHANILSCAAMQASHYYNKGALNYIYGLPEGSIEIDKPSETIVKQVLHNLNGGTPVQLYFYNITTLDTDFYAFEWLSANRDYDYVTGVMGNPPDIPAHDPEKGITFLRSEAVTPTSLKLVYFWFVKGGQYDGMYAESEETVTITTSEFNSPMVVGNRYYHVSYYLLDAALQPTGKLRYFNYDESLETHPVLSINESVEKSTYFPVVPVVLDGKDLMTRPEDTTSEEFEVWQSCRQQLAKLKLQPENISKSLFGPFDDDVDETDKPDPADLDYGYVILGASIADTRIEVIEYFHRYFKYVAEQTVFKKTDYDSWFFNKRFTPPFNKVTVKQEGYHIELQFIYIDIEQETGTLLDEEEKPVKYTREVVYNEDIEIDANTVVRKDALILRKQVAPDTIEKVIVVSPHIVTVIRGKSTDCALKDAEEDDRAFVIPLNKTVLDTMILLDKNRVVFASMQLVINSVTTVKVKWYQSSWFQIFTVAVMTVVTVVSGGASLALMSTWLEIASSALFNYMISVGVTAAIDFVLDVFGIENAFVIAVITIAAQIATQGRGTDISTMATAEKLLFYTNAVTAGVNVAGGKYFASKTEETQEKIEELKDDIEEIEKLMEQFESPVSTQAMVESIRIGSDYFVKESPSEFFYRTRIGNPGVMALRQIENFVDMALDIPGLKSLDTVKVL